MTEPKPGKTRQAELEDRKRASGMVRYCVWTYPECVPAIKACAEKTTQRAEKQRTKGTA